MNELVTIEQENALEIFTATNGLDPFMQKIKEEIDVFTPDLSTAKGRKEIASMAMKVAKSKTYLDNAGKELVSKLKEQPKLVDAERKRMRDTLDEWKEEVRRPLTDWENKEKDRVASHETGLKQLRTLAHGYIDELNSSLKNLEQLKDSLTSLEAIEMGEGWEEFEAKALLEKTKGAEKLRELITDGERKLAEAEELERLAAERAAEEQRLHEEQIAKAAAKAAKEEAEAKAKEQQKAVEEKAAQLQRETEQARQAEAAKAEEERQAAAKRESDLKAEAEAAQRKAEEAKADALREVEEEKQRESAAAAKRESDKKHKAKVNNEALTALVGAGLNKADAKTAIEAIAKNLVPSVTISY